MTTYTITFVDCTLHRKYTREVEATSYDKAIEKIIDWGKSCFHRVVICKN